MKRKVKAAMDQAKKVEKRKLLPEKILRDMQKSAEEQPGIIAKIIKSSKDWFIRDEKERGYRRRKVYK